MPEEEPYTPDLKWVRERAELDADLLIDALEDSCWERKAMCEVFHTIEAVNNSCKERDEFYGHQ